MRCHRCQRAPIFFGRSGDNRFDAPAGELGTLYLAADLPGAFIETFGQVTGIRAVTELELRRRCLSTVQSTRPVSLVDLAGAGLARLGADGRLAAGAHDLAQRWALALWRHPARPDGLFYRARHDPSRFSVALFDRVAPALTVADPTPILAPDLASEVRETLRLYGFEVLSDGAETRRD